MLNNNTDSGYFAFSMPKLNPCTHPFADVIKLSEWIKQNIGAEFMLRLADTIKDESPGSIITVTWQLLSQPSPYSYSKDLIQ